MIGNQLESNKKSAETLILYRLFVLDRVLKEISQDSFYDSLTSNFTGSFVRKFTGGFVESFVGNLAGTYKECFQGVYSKFSRNL